MENDRATASGNWARWVTPSDIAERYDIPIKQVRALANRRAWPSHRQSGMTRFSPDDQRVIEEKWQKHAGDDPPKRMPSWIELALKDNPTEQERAAIDRGIKYSRGESPYD